MHHNDQIDKCILGHQSICFLEIDLDNDLYVRLWLFIKILYLSKSNLAIMSICSHLYFNFLLLRVNVDGRKQEPIDAPEASVLFSGLLTQRKVHLYWSLYAAKGLNSARICDFDY
ncbi:hypothetical protein Hdeb2414_s0899g00959051 [Helianthus debilis subsp. tardiflorus]